MKIRSTIPSAIVLALGMFGFAGSAAAIPLLCEDASAERAYLNEIPLLSCPSAGVWVDGSLWETRNKIILGIQPVDDGKFDAWLVQYLNPLISSGDWQYEKIHDYAGRLTHIKLYGPPPTRSIPEPGTLALLGIGLLGAGIVRRRRQAR